MSITDTMTTTQSHTLSSMTMRLSTIMKFGLSLTLRIRMRMVNFNSLSMNIAVTITISRTIVYNLLHMTGGDTYHRVALLLSLKVTVKGTFIES